MVNSTFIKNNCVGAAQAEEYCLNTNEPAFTCDFDHVEDCLIVIMMVAYSYGYLWIF